MDCLPGDQQVYVVVLFVALFFSALCKTVRFFCQSGFLGGLGEPNLHVDCSVSGSAAVILNRAVLLFCVLLLFFGNFLLEESGLAHMQTACSGSNSDRGLLWLVSLWRRCRCPHIFLCWAVTAVVGKCSRFNLIGLKRVLR